MNRILLIGTSALLGLAAGVGVRAWRHAAGAEQAASRSSSASSAAPGLPPKASLSHGSKLADQTKANLSLTHGVTRWLHWMTAVESAGPGDFPGLARLAQGLPGALNMLAARWIDRDPQGMFEACLRGGAGFPANELAQQLFETWPKNDPDAVLAALQAHRNLSRGWQFTALNTLFKSHPEQALITMSQLGIDGYGPNMEGIARWAAEDPRRAAEVALGHPTGYATRLVLETVAKEWATSNPAAALTFALEQNNYSAAELAQHVLRHWVEGDLNKASAWFAAADERTREKLLPSFIEAWGKSDPNTAMEWTLQNTSGSQQAESVQSLVKGVLTRDVGAAAALVAGLEPSHIRSKAAAAFAREAVNKGWFPGLVTPEKERAAKPEAIAWLKQLDPDARKEVVTQICWSWSEGAPREFAEYLQSETGMNLPTHVLSAAARALIRESPQEAMAWAERAPEAMRPQTLRETFQHWTRSQPDAALSWLRQLPPQDPRREPLFLSTVESLVPASSLPQGSSDSPQAARAQQRRLARELASDPAAARQTLEQLPLTPVERRQLARRLGLSSD